MIYYLTGNDVHFLTATAATTFNFGADGGFWEKSTRLSDFPIGYLIVGHRLGMIFFVFFCFVSI